MAAKVGQQAPYWEAKGVVGSEIKDYKSTDYKDKWTVLFFYPRDFTFVCPTEIKGYNSVFDDFKKCNAEVIGASTDSEFVHKAWLKELGELKFPLIADTTHEITRKFGILDEGKGLAFRGTFIIDDKNVLRYSVVHDLGVGRSIEETVRVLKALQSGGLCGVDWKPGQPNLKP